MQQRNLGNNKIQIAPLVFGGNVFGWTIDKKQSFTILDAFLDAGFNCIDTADVYSNWIPGNQGGESETIIGKWMAARKNRNRVVLASKVGMEFRGEKGLSEDYIIRAIEGSLKRLQTDYLDLYQAHKDDESTDLAETLAAFESIRKSGKAHLIGASNYNPQRLQAAIDQAKTDKIIGYQTLQPQYNLFNREGFESGLEDVCVKNNLSVITYYSLASGFLTGKYRSEKDLSKSPRGQGIKARYLNERGLKIIKALDEVSEELRVTPAQVALAWLLHRPSVTAPIVSATTVEQLTDIAKAAGLKIPETQLQKLNQVSAW